MIYVDPNAPNRSKGLLIDWDLCKYAEELSNGPVNMNRSVSNPLGP